MRPVREIVSLLLFISLCAIFVLISRNEASNVKSSSTNIHIVVLYDGVTVRAGCFVILGIKMFSKLAERG